MSTIMWRTWFRWTHRSLLFLLIGLILLSYLGPWSLWCNMLVHFRLQYTLLLGLSAIVSWLLSDQKLIWVAVLVGMLQGVSVAKVWLPKPDVPNTTTETLEIISWNV
ncbi:MAG: hypothetical protein AAF399_21295, partial [Bacteroidota bacterium]